MIALGIHFGLNEDLYHADPALGSTDLRSLRRGAKLQIETKATIVGTAMHVCVLEGIEKFRRLYVRRPDDKEDATSSDKSATTRAANAAAAKVGRISLHGTEYDLIETCARVIDEHPDLSGALSGAATEVSIFWERDGVRMKCRIDALKPRGIGDLKSIQNERQDRLSVACKWAIKKRRYDIQGEHYMEGRDHLPKLFKAGLVFFHGEFAGAERDRLTKLLEACSSAKGHAFQFIFVPKDGTPTVWSCILSRRNPMLSIARQHIEEALDIYRRHRDAYTQNARWAIIEPVGELHSEDMPGGDFGWD
jgi:ABC-type transporter lipoprotein component MlaA